MSRNTAACSIWSHTGVPQVDRLTDYILLIDLRLLIYYERNEYGALDCQVANEIPAAFLAQLQKYAKTARVIIYYDKDFEADFKAVYGPQYLTLDRFLQLAHYEVSGVIDVVKCSSNLEAELAIMTYRTIYTDARFYHIVGSDRMNQIDASLFSGVVPIHNRKFCMDRESTGQFYAWLDQEGFLGTGKVLSVYLDIDDSAIDVTLSCHTGQLHLNKEVIQFLKELVEKKDVTIELFFCTAREHTIGYTELDASVKFNNRLHAIEVTNVAAALNKQLPAGCFVKGVYYSNNDGKVEIRKHQVLRSAAEVRGEFALLIDDVVKEIEAVSALVRSEMPRCIAPPIRVHQLSAIAAHTLDQEMAIIQQSPGAKYG